VADFKKLEVWRKAHSLALYVHRVALGIRGSPYISLRNQIIRASMSIPANIVEGREQKSDLEFARFLRYALGSASELEYHLIIARDIRVIESDDFISLVRQVKDVRMMLFGFLKKLDPATARSKGAKEDTAIQ
jgi:four helix bundle protein